MAKMFYSLDEAAEKLGVSEDQVKQMVSDGKLQQYRDRDNLMFKVDQVDKVAASQAAANEESGEISLEDTSAGSGVVDLSDTGGGSGGGKAAEESAGIDLSDTSAGSSGGFDLGDTGESSAVDLGDTSEQPGVLDSEIPADEDSGKTRANEAMSPEASDAAYDSIGSGSGLLDLTQESDDTSLGSVELLDDAPSGSGLGSAFGSDLGGSGLESDAKMGESSDVLAGSSTGIFEAAGGAESSSPVVESGGEVYEDDVDLDAVAYESTDSADGFVGGVLAGVFIVLVLGVLITIGGVRGYAPAIAKTFAEADFGMFYWILGVACLVFGVLGMFFSRR